MGLLALNDYFEVIAQDASLLMQLLPIIKNAVAPEKRVQPALLSLFSAKPKAVKEEHTNKKQHIVDDLKIMDILEP